LRDVFLRAAIFVRTFDEDVKSFTTGDTEEIGLFINLDLFDSLH